MAASVSGAVRSAVPTGVYRSTYKDRHVGEDGHHHISLIYLMA